MSTSDNELDRLRAIDPRIPDDFRERFERYTGEELEVIARADDCLLYTSPSPRDGLLSRMPSSA